MGSARKARSSAASLPRASPASSAAAAYVEPIASFERIQLHCAFEIRKRASLILRCVKKVVDRAASASVRPKA